MKNLISILSFIFVANIATFAAHPNNVATAGNLENSKPKLLKDQKNDEVKVYYFHATHRCVTCEAVEAVSKEALKEYYGDKVPFESINREKEKDNPLVKKYKISGQTLLIVKGDKTVDLTSVAFMNARNNPEKLKSRIKTTIDPML